MRLTEASRRVLAARRELRDEAKRTGIDIYTHATGRDGKRRQWRVRLESAIADTFHGSDEWRNSRAVAALVMVLIRKEMLTAADVADFVDADRYLVRRPPAAQL